MHALTSLACDGEIVCAYIGTSMKVLAKASAQWFLLRACQSCKYSAFSRKGVHHRGIILGGNCLNLPQTVLAVRSNRNELRRIKSRFHITSSEYVQHEG